VFFTSFTLGGGRDGFQLSVAGSQLSAWWLVAKLRRKCLRRSAIYPGGRTGSIPNLWCNEKKSNADLHVILHGR
jgi:hypothetical protein